MVNIKRLQEIQNLLESYNMKNTAKSATRITLSTDFLIDVIITYKDIPVLYTAVVDLDLSDHRAQIVEINIAKKMGKPKRL